MNKTSVAIKSFLAGVLFIWSPILGLAEQSPSPLDWPRHYELDNGRSLLIYQPQFERWADGLELRGSVVIAYGRSSQDSPLLGTLILDASTESDVASSLVRIYNIRLLEGAFPGLNFKESKILTSQLTGLLPKQLVMSLDQVLVGIRRGGKQPSPEDPQDDPPNIVVRQKAAILLQFSGEPEWRQIEGLGLQVATNTDSDLFLLEKKNKLYLLDGQTWLQASSVRGPWTVASKLPKSFSKLDDLDEDWSRVVTAIPARSVAQDQVPEVIVSSQPTELVVIEGEPQTEAIDGTDLLWVTNTENDLFVQGPQQTFFLLAAGRWYQTDSLVGAWMPVELEGRPSDLGRIPRQHEKADVLSFVPGTPEAMEASIRAQIPQQTSLSNSDALAEATDFVVLGENDLFAGLDGQVYRREGDEWMRHDSDGWSPAPPPKEPELDPSTGKFKWGPDTLKNANRRRVYNLLEWDYQSRRRGGVQARENVEVAE